MKGLAKIVLSLAATLGCANAGEYPRRYWDDVKSLRGNAVMKCEGKPEVMITGNYSTASPFFQLADKVYYVTVRHGVFRQPTPSRGCEIKSLDYVLSDGMRDQNFSDDVKVEVELVGFDSDVAILSTDRKNKLYTIPKHAVPNLGEKIYLVGWPKGHDRILDAGFIASEKTDMQPPYMQFGTGWWATNDFTPGQSGSPAYVKREGQYKLIGVLAGGFGDNNTSYIVDIKNAKRVMNMIRLEQNSKGDGW